jgi:hypothetical protein
MQRLNLDFSDKASIHPLLNLLGTNFLLSREWVWTCGWVELILTTLSI